MEKFVPFEKLSKKEKRKQNRARRNGWGALSPVTRKPANPRAYKRRKAQRPDDGDAVPFVFSALTYPDSTSKAPASARPGRCGR
jgi:hypothetical protein